jgi:ubiquitin C-terminal hydrolase
MEKGIIGLKNRGNTCYLNTSIQCLSNIPKLTEYFTSNEYVVDLNNRFEEIKSKSIKEILLTREYSKLIKAMWNNTSSIEPKSFHELIQRIDDRFSGYDQQDSQESLSLILDNLHEGLKYDVDITYSGKTENNVDEIVIESIKNWSNELKNKYSIIVDLFFGQYVNKIVSVEKNSIISTKFEVFNMLSIPIFGKTLYDSLAKFFEKETLETPFFDEKINESVNAYKTIRLVKVPKYLIIVLKRYQNDTGSLLKSTNMVTFPIKNLDLSHYSDGYDKYGCLMNLVCVGCHSGGLNGGHYYSICKNINNKWYKYDDDTVSEINIENSLEILFKHGYILIYEKK